MKITQITDLATTPRVSKFNDGDVVKDYTSQSGNAFKLLLAKGVEISLQNGFVRKSTLAGVLRIPTDRWDDADLNLYKGLIKNAGFIVKTSTSSFYAGQEPVPNSNPEIYRDVVVTTDSRMKGKALHVQLSPEEVEMPDSEILNMAFNASQEAEVEEVQDEIKAPF